jgi:hypothetical protein
MLRHAPDRYKYGTGPSWAIGTAAQGGLADSNGSGYAYMNSVAAYWGINRDYYDTAIYPHVGANSAYWVMMNRAYLRVPIAEYSPENIANFRLWLDGFEDISITGAGSENWPYYFKNPELFGDGKTFLSTAIYPGHPDLDRARMLTTFDMNNNSSTGIRTIAFSSRTAETTATINPSRVGSLFNKFRKGSGEALGTILDFFSPPVAGIGDVTTNAHNVGTAPEISFPLRDPCEKNWVILFTAGDDSSEYSSAHAAADLYTYTKNKNLTKFKEVNGSGNNVFEEIKLEDGVRTLVVGFVDPDSTAPNVVALRDNLNAIAAAGDPGNSEAKAFFANDVEGLIHALRAVLARINSEIQPAKGSMLEGDSFGDESYSESLDSDILNLYAGSYRINI